MATTPRHDANDARDDEELAAVAQILEELPENHRARLAFRAGASTLTLIDLVGHKELAGRLADVWREAVKRAAKPR